MRRQAFLLFGLVVLVVAGCGGGAKHLTKAQYEQRLQADGKAALRARNSIAAPKGPLALAKALAQEQATLRRSADDLASVRPPADAELDNATIVRGLRALASAFEPIRRKLASGKAVDVSKESLREPKAVADAQVAVNDLKRKGYNVGVFGT